MIGIKIRTNAQHARQLSAMLSPTRSFVPVARGVYVMECTDEVQAIRDADFLTSNRLVSDPEIVTTD